VAWCMRFPAHETEFTRWKARATTKAATKVGPYHEETICGHVAASKLGFYNRSPRDSLMG